ncbi:unnamed protein product [Rotaria magnacalcarata]|uniref:Apple domain-containing protein n=2 Tax=Rotaria magnacalcarata TaxID=392030 RepID=A0A819KLN7_9BILA|nr:unnamed protein product [Rotaria magnacalcarata]
MQQYWWTTASSTRRFTLGGWGSSDYYDLSNVDGNSMSMTIRPISGQYTVVNNPSLGKQRTYLIRVYVHHSCKWTTVLFIKYVAVFALQFCNAQQRARFDHLQNIYKNPDTRSLLCCSHDGNHGISLVDNVTPGGKCYVEQWPKLTQNTRYDQVFKSQCPDAYSWQFDDFASGSGSSLQWNGNKWTLSCDFPGNDMSNVRTRGEDCGGKCAQTSGCTHFAWNTYEGGTCWLKSGSVSKSNAVPRSDVPMICGVV